MSKLLEQAAKEFSDKYWSNLTDYEKISCFKAGAEFMQKEYEEKLRWIPVEEKLPDIDSDYPNFSLEVHVKNSYQSHIIAYYFFNEKRWCFDNNSIDNVTHWRSFL